MYLRVTRRTNKDGSVVEYLQLAHNVWRPGSPHPHVQAPWPTNSLDSWLA